MVLIQSNLLTFGLQYIPGLDKSFVDQFILNSLKEDVGDGDVTTAATVPAQTRAHAVIRQKAPGVIYGLDVAEEVFRSLDAEATFTREVTEGEWREAGALLGKVERSVSWWLAMCRISGTS